jgi:hypothetical protein
MNGAAWNLVQRSDERAAFVVGTPEPLVEDIEQGESAGQRRARQTASNVLARTSSTIH